MVPLKLPDITPAQIIAIVGSVFGILVAAGLDVSEELQNSIIDFITVVAPILLVSDAAIRHGRSRALQNPPKGEVSSDSSGATTTGPGA